MKIPQPLLVTKGRVFVDYKNQTFFGYRVALGKTLTLTGFNLFEGDIRFDLIDRFNKIHSLIGVLFEKYGRQLQLTIPASLPPGQYVLRTYAKGFKEPVCLRVNVLKDDQVRPTIGTLVTQTASEASPCSIMEPVAAQRGIALFFTSTLEKSVLDKLGQHAALKLVSVSSGASYSGSVVAYDYANSVFPGSFTIPTIVPPGLFTATLQVLDMKNNVVDESEPYGRLVQIN
ncbi:hypothetical protein [Spirosoma spitsbergense]|uniref:hypothetical protein n=1 Tax=Spirosoma spitsbergense TaxID=431554 RepID=UPI00037953D2|nr:hypothetical protein [Spirosoma spitsbergense]